MYAPFTIAAGAPQPEEAVAPQRRERRTTEFGWHSLLAVVWLGWLGAETRVQAQPAGARAEAPSLMATYLTHFVHFTTWPDSVRAGIAARAGSGFVVGVLGSDPFGDRLEEAFRGKRFGDQPILVRRLRTDAEVRDCQLVFISRSESGRLRLLLEDLQDRPVLTVSDIPGFVEAGGHVGFHEQRSKLHFNINLEGTRRSGLTMSSQLLKLAWNLQRDRK